MRGLLILLPNLSEHKEANCGSQVGPLARGLPVVRLLGGVLLAAQGRPREGA